MNLLFQGNITLEKMSRVFLGNSLRPNYHHIERRCDGHIFITLLAYHIMQTIRTKLREKGIAFCWETVRVRLSSHMRVSTTLKREDGKVAHIRKSSRAEPNHKEIYDALDLSHEPGKIMKAIILMKSESVVPK